MQSGKMKWCKHGKAQKSQSEWQPSAYAKLLDWLNVEVIIPNVLKEGEKYTEIKLSIIKENFPYIFILNGLTGNGVQRLIE